jgi:hypothetical protein
MIEIKNIVYNNDLSKKDFYNYDSNKDPIVLIYFQKTKQIFNSLKFIKNLIAQI